MIEWGMHDAAVAAALRVGIADAPLFEHAELLHKLAVASPQLFASWKVLREKYDAWIKFQAGIESSGGLNSPADSERQVTVNTELEKARSAFVGVLKAPLH